MTVRLIPYLVMNGNAKEAIKFYENALDAQVLYMQSFEEGPENPEYPLPEDAKDRVMHATLKVGETELMFSDTFPGQPHQSGNQVTICISTKDPEKARKMYDALQEGGKVNMPLQETFFSPAYGNVTDKFGVEFQIYTEGKH
ncbi:VOC family protein [Metabacillus sediminilitoris]|uniref:VOC family protein n=1 Tax=Metabacillus sediminilitoris TaxID=2567941 RepID=A0A4S4BT32_9BACI|nr:VOC family protein [Metabacillus sediminilitoris]QGQ44268.1 VOC family protein [Metabacillus sediminilitoris]THF78231.1 VOC family protein [Metabacillus sediminilitoris]